MSNVMSCLHSLLLMVNNVSSDVSKDSSYEVISLTTNFKVRDK